MPRFYLHILSRGQLIEDDEGIDYADLATAVAQAVTGARCLMNGEVTAGTLCLDQSIEIHGGDGRHLQSVPFTQALTVIGRTQVPGDNRESAGG